MMIHIPLNNTFCSHARGILLTMLVSLFTIQNVSAKDDALYDGMYDRPSYFPDFTQPTTWPTTMSYFIYVRDVDGKKLSNYEVAVYDQDGILRTIGRSRKSQGELCTLTIPGVKGHTFTFKVLYGDFEHPTIVDATTEQEVAYKADNVVGGPANPFWLTIPAMRITGDVDGDGKLSISDMTALVNLLKQNPALIPDGVDVNSDTKLDLQDVTALQELLLQKQ